MIVAIGTDMVSVPRIGGVLARKPRFVHRILTEQEQQACRGALRVQRVAARFAGKEAVLKALGTGLRACRWRDIDIRSGDMGAPVVALSGGAAEHAAEAGIARLHLSLSHTDDFALAFAVAVDGRGGSAVGAGGGVAQ